MSSVPIAVEAAAGKVRIDGIVRFVGGCVVADGGDALLQRVKGDLVGKVGHAQHLRLLVPLRIFHLIDLHGFFDAAFALGTVTGDGELFLLHILAGKGDEGEEEGERGDDGRFHDGPCDVGGTVFVRRSSFDS